MYVVVEYRPAGPRLAECQLFMSYDDALKVLDVVPIPRLPDFRIMRLDEPREGSDETS